MGKGIKRIYICSMLNEFDGKFMFKKKKYPTSKCPMD